MSIFRLVRQSPFVFLLALLPVVLTELSFAEGNNDYEKTVAQWQSYKDVGKWLENNFTFDLNRARYARARVVSQGPSGLVVHPASKTFSEKRGYCVDAAAFSMDALSKINPAYQPRWIFVKNKMSGEPSHWVVGFMVEEKLYVMDYGAGPEWWTMKGLHGPYSSLDEYAEFLGTLHIRGFSVDKVIWYEMPGMPD